RRRSLMEIWHHSLEAAPQAGASVVTLGNFDGVHAGHRELLAEAAASAKAKGLRSAVVTFDPHPAIVVAPERKPKMLMTLDQRLAAFRDCGVDLAWIIPFSRAFSELAPEAFLDGLARALSPVELHVGRAFRFGRDRTGDLALLRAWGFGHGCGVQGHALRAPDGGLLSSTRVREALEAGEAGEAARLLGHPFSLTGIVVEGDRRGRHLGFPTANLAWDQEQLPANGVYVVEVRSGHFEGPRLGLTNVGEKPTFEGRRLTVETHLPGFEGDLYGARLELRFLHRVRGERKFGGPDELRAQIAKDVAEGEAWWQARR
ncbi:MAG TPA: riboflavin biosynthesis protein RibF, partial [Holophagaceae bacterium]|nr:riboflavin biosynthesis protein RibF [Holophagaceae bacterium]